MKDIFFYLKEQLDIVEIISSYIQLTPMGNYFRGLSPFKNEKTPSFTVTPSKKIFYCFSTHIGGDVIDFISRIENCSQLEAAQFLIKKYNIIIPSEYKIKHTNTTNTKDKYFQIYQTFFSWCHTQLIKNKNILEYLLNRSITVETIIKYNLGYCPENNFINTCIDHFKKNNIHIEDIQITDIIITKNKKYYLSAQDRIIFPIKNNLDEPCGYGSRAIKENDPRPKYVNTGNNEFFIKKNILYGLTEAREFIKKQKNVNIVEGYMDTLAMYQSGYQNTVATMGTALTKEHIEYIKKYVTSVNIIYDGDEAGKKAIIRSLSLFWNENIDVYVIMLPPNEDPASLCQKKIIHQYINKKISAISFFISEAKNNIENNNLSIINITLTHIADIINKIDCNIKKTAIIIKISKELAISQEMIISFLKNIKNKNINTTIKKTSLNNALIKTDTLEDQSIKQMWYIFFYANLHLYEKNFIPIQNIIFLFRQFAPAQLTFLLEEYQNNYDENISYLDFLKKNNIAIYNHSLKYSSIYNFSKKQYYIIYNKIILKLWKIYKLKNTNKNLKDFLLYINYVKI